MSRFLFSLESRRWRPRAGLATGWRLTRQQPQPPVQLKRSRPRPVEPRLPVVRPTIHPGSRPDRRSCSAGRGRSVTRSGRHRVPGPLHPPKLAGDCRRTPTTSIGHAVLGRQHARQRWSGRGAVRSNWRSADRRVVQRADTDDLPAGWAETSWSSSRRPVVGCGQRQAEPAEPASSFLRPRGRYKDVACGSAALVCPDDSATGSPTEVKPCRSRDASAGRAVGGGRRPPPPRSDDKPPAAERRSRPGV